MKLLDNIKQEINSDYLDTKQLELASQIGLPNPKIEQWKYTPLTLPISEFKYIDMDEGIEPIELFKLVDKFPIENDIPIYLYNGKICNVFPSIKNQVEENEYSYYFKDFFYHLNNSTKHNHYSISFDNKQEKQIFSILSGSFAKTDNHIVNSHIRFVVPRNSDIEIYFYFANFNKNVVLQNNYFSFNVEESANLKVFIVENDSNNLNVLNNFYFKTNNNSVLNLYAFALEGNFIRNNFQIDIEGEYSDNLLNGLYIGKKRNIVDNHILVNHLKPNAHSNQFFKGILEDKSRGVFNGKIYVAKGSQKTNAYQSNKNILTSEEAQIFTKPELEIYADDVKCSHGATSGFLQENELFYLMSRGIPREESKAMLLKAFANEIIEQIANDEFVQWLERKVEEII